MHRQALPCLQHYGIRRSSKSGLIWTLSGYEQTGAYWQAGLQTCSIEQHIQRESALVVNLNRLPRGQNCVRDGRFICCVSFSHVGFEFHCHPPAPFFRSELARYGKHLPAPGTAPGDGVAIYLVNHNQFCHGSSISQIGYPELSNSAQYWFPCACNPCLVSL